MRITCPNCSAQYEIDGSLIADTGREVQCSNCNTRWFQSPEAKETNDSNETSDAQKDAKEPVKKDKASAARTPPPPPPAPPPAPAASSESATRRKLDPEVERILREEAEREAALRKRKSAPQPIETQEEFLLESASRGATHSDLARAPDAFDAAPNAEEKAQGSRSGLLPEIAQEDQSLEEENQPATDSVHAVPPATTKRKNARNKRLGFVVSAGLAAGCAGLYAFGDRLAERFPSTAPMVDTYAAQVDSLRITLDGFARSLVATEADPDAPAQN